MNKMPPNIGHLIRKDVADLPDFDEEKFWIYSVFREKILDKIIREELKEIGKSWIETQKKRKERQKLKRELKSQEHVPPNLGCYSIERVFSAEREYINHNMKKEIIQK